MNSAEVSHERLVGNSHLNIVRVLSWDLWSEVGRTSTFWVGPQKKVGRCVGSQIAKRRCLLILWIKRRYVSIIYRGAQK